MKTEPKQARLIKLKTQTLHGDYNVSTYNGWLAGSRYWNSIPLIGTTVYDPPADLKYVRVK